MRIKALSNHVHSDKETLKARVDLFPLYEVDNVTGLHHSEKIVASTRIFPMHWLSMPPIVGTENGAIWFANSPLISVCSPQLNHVGYDEHRKLEQ